MRGFHCASKSGARRWLATALVLSGIPGSATSVGAAIAGGIGIGIFSSIEDADRLVHVTEEVKPIKEDIPVKY